jgi:hypothetical protein
VIGWINIIFGFLGMIGSAAIVIISIIGLNAIDLSDDDRSIFIGEKINFKCIGAFIKFIYYYQSQLASSASTRSLL